MTARVPFADLTTQWAEIAPVVEPALLDLMRSGQYILGPHVARFEREFAALSGRGQAIAVSSGTAALHLAFIAAGIKPGDEVLVPATTFVATAWAVVYVGAIPVFVDCNPENGLIDPEDAEARISPKTRAVIPVHLYGQVADMPAINEMAARHGLVVIEDAAQAHGAVRFGKNAGAFSPLAAFSFYPGKNLGAAGEGGAVVCDDPDVAERLRALRDHGQRQRYVHDEIGFNYRMDAIQGLILAAKLPHLAKWTAVRRRIANLYHQGLRGIEGITPARTEGESAYHLFVIHTAARDELRTYLDGKGIDTGLHYPVPLHRQPCFAHLRQSARPLPHAEKWANGILSLPLFGTMSDAQAERVITAVRGFVETLGSAPPDQTSMGGRAT